MEWILGNVYKLSIQPYSVFILNDRFMNAYFFINVSM